MTVIVTDAGFVADDLPHAFAPITGDPAARALDLAPDADPDLVAARLDSLEVIRITFPDVADGRGFTLARLLRLRGYRGRLRAAGHVIADQYAMARRSGYDEVEIDSALALRQPEEQWRDRANWRAHDYQARLRGQA